MINNRVHAFSKPLTFFNCLVLRSSDGVPSVCVMSQIGSSCDTNRLGSDFVTSVDVKSIDSTHSCFVLLKIKPADLFIDVSTPCSVDDVVEEVGKEFDWSCDESHDLSDETTANIVSNARILVDCRVCVVFGKTCYKRKRFKIRGCEWDQERRSTGEWSGRWDHTLESNLLSFSQTLLQYILQS